LFLLYVSSVEVTAAAEEPHCDVRPLLVGAHRCDHWLKLLISAVVILILCA